MARVIAVTNPKGGVGKSTTVINLAASLAIAEKRVLVVDVDPQGSTSLGLGFRPEKEKTGIFEIFSGSFTALDPVHSAPFPELRNISVIPSNVPNVEMENRLMDLAKNRIRLKLKLSDILAHDTYDFVLIDTPPALGDLTISALSAAHSLIVPLQCGYFSLQVMPKLFTVLERMKKSVNPDLEIEGILLTYYEKGTRASQLCVEGAVAQFGKYLFETVVPKNSALGYAQFKGKPLALVDISAPGSVAYLKLADELIDKARKRQERSGILTLSFPTEPKKEVDKMVIERSFSA